MDPVTLTLGKKYTRNRVAPAYATSLYNPAVDIVYDSCYREVNEPLDVYANDVKTDSGHSWTRVVVGEATPTLEYLPGGALRAGTTGVSRYIAGEAASVVAGFESVRPYIKVRARNRPISYDFRYYFVKWISPDNWLAIRTQNIFVDVLISVNGERTVLASTSQSSTQIFAFHSSNVYEVSAALLTTHTNTSPSGVFLRASIGGEYLNAPLSVDQWDAISAPGTVGFSIGSNQGSDLLGFVAGRGDF